LGIKYLMHPARSPDLNPIEHIWFELKCKVQRTPGAYKSVHALWEATRQAWEELTDKDIRRVTSKMGRVPEAVIEKKGGTVKVF
ncbi:hypothetical protein GY45DRAFT_1264425, partial [Cubamyces sp. BRFM 1775]